MGTWDAGMKCKCAETIEKQKEDYCEGNRHG